MSYARWSTLLLALGCSGGKPEDTATSEGDADTDADSDADTDADTDTGLTCDDPATVAAECRGEALPNVDLCRWDEPNAGTWVGSFDVWGPGGEFTTADPSPPHLYLGGSPAAWAALPDLAGRQVLLAIDGDCGAYGEGEMTLVISEVPAPGAEVDDVPLFAWGRGAGPWALRWIAAALDDTAGCPAVEPPQTSCWACTRALSVAFTAPTSALVTVPAGATVDDAGLRFTTQYAYEGAGQQRCSDGPGRTAASWYAFPQ